MEAFSEESMIEVGIFCLKSTEDVREFCPHKIGIALPPTTAVYGVWHKSSQVSLLALAEHLKPGMTVLDLGTGTGVLAVAAEKLGASKVYATEVQEEALTLASKTFQANECTRVHLIRGTFIDAEVDICIANVDEGEKWVREHLHQIKAKKVMAISNEGEVVVVRGI